MSSLWLAGVVGAIGALVLWWRNREAAKPLLLMVALAAAPITLVHLVYFFVQSRFHLPFTAGEDPYHIIELHRQGVPVYLDTTWLDPLHPSTRLMLSLFERLERPVGLPQLPQVD